MPRPSHRPPETTAVASDVEQEVLAAYQEFWQVWLRANNPPNPDYPDLPTLAHGCRAASPSEAAIAKKARRRHMHPCFRSGSQYRHQRDRFTLDRAGDEVIVTDCCG